MQRRLAPGRLRTSLPSWLHMPSLGLPPVDSSCSLVPSDQPHSRSHSAADSYPGDGRGAAEAAVQGAEAAPDPDGSCGGGALDASRHASSGGVVALGIPVPAGAAGVPDLGAAGGVSAVGLQATAGMLAAAIQEAPGEGLDDFEPATPADRPRTQQLEGSASEAGLFESPSAAWRDLVVLSAACGGQGGGDADACPY